jgi:hypothetical protein
MLIVPLNPVPNQTAGVALGGQNVILNVYQEMFGLFMDVELAGAQVVGGVICQNLNRIVRDLYLGFAGDFIWIDTNGGNNPSDPFYTGIGSRFVLGYLTTSDLATAGVRFWPLSTG